MPTPAIFNSVASADLDVVELADPALINFYATSLAAQVNDFRMTYAPQKRVVDLEKWVSDVNIETTAQGGSLLEVDIIDPGWTLLQRDAAGVCYIDVDDTGYIWPPIEVTFPPDISSAVWRLCQVRASTDLTGANLTLVFEDKIVSELREHFGAETSFPDQTRIEFIQSLVRKANRNPAYPGEVDIRFVALLPKSTFTQADLTMSERLPASATQPHPPKARKDPNKGPDLNHYTQPKPLTAAEVAAGVVDLSVEAGLNAYRTTPFVVNDPFAPPPVGPRVGIG